MRKFASNIETVVRDPADIPISSSLPTDLKAGERLADKYLLVRPLGLGGMGEVWLAKNEATGAEVALKVLLPERLAAHDALERFRREAHATAQLSHRAIVRAFDLIDLDPAKGKLLLVLERLHGHTLADRLEHVGRLTIPETLDVVLPILSGLEHAHRAGVVHRDLKPENIFLAVEPDGQVLPKLVDFGISKMRNATLSITARGALVGTPCYMAPEQARAEEIDPRTDIFAMGIVLHECLSGTVPFNGGQLHEVVRSVLEDEPLPLPGIPEDLWGVIACALAKRPEDRYPTAASLAEALIGSVPAHHAALRPLSVPSPAPKSLTSVPPAVSPTVHSQFAPTPRRPWGTVVGIAAMAALAAIVIGRARFEGVGRSAVGALPEREFRPAKHLTASSVDVPAPRPAALLPPAPAPVLRRASKAAPKPAPPPDPPEAAEAPKPPSMVRDPGF
ncbi:MAG TPA: serine/threonine-protein kinase [Polyangiaceae bacterium]|jgi:serine/threonine-protein kinase